MVSGPWRQVFEMSLSIQVGELLLHFDPNVRVLCPAPCLLNKMPRNKCFARVHLEVWRNCHWFVFHSWPGNRFFGESGKAEEHWGNLKVTPRWAPTSCKYGYSSA